MYKKLKLVESTSDRYQVREFDGPGAKFGVYDTKTKKFVQKGSKKVMTAACEDLNNKNKKLTEGNFDKAQAVLPLDNYHAMGIIVSDNGETVQYMYSNDEDKVYESEIEFDEEGNPFFRDENGEIWMISDFMRTNFGESIIYNTKANLTEADDEELEDIQDDAKEDLENQEELEDTVDGEEDQEENPVEEESELDTQLNELRDILVDLDLNLYQITDKEDLNNSVYIIGKVAEDSDDVLMLVDTKPEDVNSEEIPEEEPIIDKIDIDNADIDNDLEESALKESKENKLTWEQFEEAMTNASKEGKEIKGVIVFSPESFDKEYSEESRSYRVSSNNKYWDGSKLGSSLFGYCLDGTDQGARLDWYMKAIPEDGLGKRWIVDYCYLEDDKLEEKMNGFFSTNSNAEELFEKLKDAEDIDTKKWNNSSREERIEMVKPIIINFYKENKDKINKNWHDFMELLEYWNYHTEYQIFKELKNSKTLDESEDTDLENNEESKEDEHKTELEQRFDFVKLPNTFEEINKLNPRYGEELTPDHESIVEYLMNCLIEINPEAAEELQNNEETPIESEEDIDLDIDINREEDLNNEDQY